MKIVILDGYALNPGDLSYDVLKQFGDLAVYDRTDSEAEAIARIGDGEIVLTNKVPITESLLAACPGIRLVCVMATGYNVVDCAACARRSIPVTNVPSYGTAAVAQFTRARLLELCHHVGLHDRDVHSGGWAKAGCFTYWLTPQTELAGKTMGIVGFGAIGKAVGRLAQAFGMHVLAYNRSQSEEGRSIAAYVDLDTLLAQSDVVSLHCPLFPEPEHIINAEALSKTILLNTARGPLVEEKALAQALQAGKLRGAAVDVTNREPIPMDSPLLSCPNCIITPHIAWAPVESRQRLLDTVVENIRAYLCGTPQNVVNR